MSFGYSESSFSQHSETHINRNSTFHIEEEADVDIDEINGVGLRVTGEKAKLKAKKATFTSVPSTHTEHMEQSHSGVNFSLGAVVGMAMTGGLSAGAGAGLIGTGASQALTAATIVTPSFGESTRDVRQEWIEEPAGIAVRDLTLETDELHTRNSADVKGLEHEDIKATVRTHTEHQRVDEVSESHSEFGAMLRLATAEITFTQVGSELLENLNRTFAKDKVKGQAYEALTEEGVEAGEAVEVLADKAVNEDIETLSHLQGMEDSAAETSTIPATAESDDRAASNRSTKPLLSDRDLDTWGQVFSQSMNEDHHLGKTPAEVKAQGIALARHMKERHSYWKGQGLNEEQAWTNVRFEVSQAVKGVQSQPGLHQVGLIDGGVKFLAQKALQAFAKVTAKASGKTTEAAKFAAKHGKKPIRQMTDRELMHSAAERARKAIPGKGPRVGQQRHKYAEKLLERYQDKTGERSDLILEQPYKGGREWEKGDGLKDMVKPDVYNQRTGEVFDYKFGNATLGQRQIDKLQQQMPRHGEKPVTVIEVKPGTTV